MPINGPDQSISSPAARGKLSQWVVNERLVAERNAKYWDNAHTVINKVTYLPISSRPLMSTATAGEIDIVYTVPINQFAQLQKTMGDQWTFRRSWRPTTTNSILPGRRLTTPVCVAR